MVSKIKHGLGHLTTCGRPAALLDPKLGEFISGEKSMSPQKTPTWRWLEHPPFFKGDTSSFMAVFSMLVMLVFWGTYLFSKKTDRPTSIHRLCRSWQKKLSDQTAGGSFRFRNYTPWSFKIWHWKTMLSYWVLVTFQGRTVNPGRILENLPI